MGEKLAVVIVIFSCFFSSSVSGEDTNKAGSSSSKSEMDIINRFLEEPDLVTENLTLNSTHPSVTIRYKVYLRNALIQENTKWIITNEVPEAVGLKISIVDIDLDYREDSIRVYREQCRFKDSIHYFEDGPIVHLSNTLDIEFHKSFTGLGKGFKIEVSSISEGQESPCGGETEISMDSNTETIFVRDSQEPRDKIYEHLWTIKSQEPHAKGFKITFNKTKLNTDWDQLNISGEACSYGFFYDNYDLRNQSQLPPLNIAGSWMTVYLKLDSYGYYKYENLQFTVDLLDETENTDCSVCKSASLGDYCDVELCSCAARYSYCHKFRHVCRCADGSFYEDGKCVSEYVCDGNNRCVSYHGSFDQKGTLKSWNESQAICEEEGARLVHITDEQFNEFVATQESAQYFGYYIGSDNGGYENWIKNDLSDGCPVMATRVQKWLKLPCGMEMGFICEKVTE